MIISDNDVVIQLKRILTGLGVDPNTIVQTMYDSEIVTYLKRIALAVEGLGESQTFIATEGQKVFNTDFDLSNTFKVSEQGYRVVVGFAKTGARQITFSEPLAENTEIIIDN